MSLMPAFAPVAATAYRLDNRSLDATVSPSGGALNNFYSLRFKPDGTRFFIADGDNGIDVYYFDCSTAWDVSTASYNNSIRLKTAAGADEILQSWGGVEFSNDGTSMVVASITGSSARQLNLSVPYGGTSLGTALPNIGGSRSIFFNENGSLFFTCTLSGNLNSYTPSTAYDLSAIGAPSLVNAIGGESAIPARSGTRIINVNGTTVKEFSTPTAWNFSSLTLENSFTETGVRWAGYSGDGKKFYTLTSSQIKQYSTVG